MGNNYNGKFKRKRLAVAECHSHLDCSKQSKDLPYCCKTSFHSWAPHECFSNCAGKACDSDSNCGGTGGECCNTVYGNCTTKKSCLKTCYSNSDCKKGSTYCCKGVYFVPSVCASSCVGRSCSFNSDCGAPNECCRGGKCTKVCNGSLLPGWLIAVFAIVGVLIVVGFIIIIYCWCSARSSSLPTRNVRNGFKRFKGSLNG
ncbi:hypothetical protein AC249_AIPGENE7479 [Exaiptasia diaphana]|nr:hypothetical protein AC249_AIPGENE7479 [Exaiptasia diaphana]